MRNKILSLLGLLLTVASGTWAQEVTVTKTDGKTNEWTLTMPAGNVTVNVVYVPEVKLTVGAGEYATFYCEDALYCEDKDAELYSISSVTTSEAVLSDKIETVPAKTPILVYNSGDADQTFTLTPTEGGQLSAIQYAAEFKGTLEDKKMEASNISADYYVCTGEAFAWVNTAGTIKANKCWLEITNQPAEARAMTRSITHGGDTTGLKAVDSRETEDGNYYDLQGRKVEKPNGKGIYIHNGRKVIVMKN